MAEDEQYIVTTDDSFKRIADTVRWLERQEYRDIPRETFVPYLGMAMEVEVTGPPEEWVPEDDTIYGDTGTSTLSTRDFWEEGLETWNFSTSDRDWDTDLATFTSESDSGQPNSSSGSGYCDDDPMMLYPAKRVSLGDPNRLCKDDRWGSQYECWAYEINDAELKKGKKYVGYVRNIYQGLVVVHVTATITAGSAAGAGNAAHCRVLAGILGEPDFNPGPAQPSPFSAYAYLAAVQGFGSGAPPDLDIIVWLIPYFQDNWSNLIFTVRNVTLSMGYPYIGIGLGLNYTATIKLGEDEDPVELELPIYVTTWTPGRPACQSGNEAIITGNA